MQKKITDFFKILIVLIFFTGCNNEEVDVLSQDKTPPSLKVSFTGVSDSSKEDKIVASKELEIKIDAKDANGIESIEVFINEKKKGEDTKAPFLITVDLSDYKSKTSKKMYKDYTLKVVAKDRAGNISFEEHILNIDNEIPVISNVSLEEGMILQGDSNIVTFNVKDNEKISKVNVFTNDTLTEEIEEEGELKINLDTSLLSDGKNIFRIEAIDQANNKVVYEVNFITDNTGPEINIDNLIKNLVIDEVLMLKPTASDVYSEVASVEIIFNDKSLFLTEEKSNISYEFDPDTVGAGEGVFIFKAIDNLGNITNIEIPVNIHRRLITINIPENRINQAIITSVVFVSRMDGTLITSKEITGSDREVVLSTPKDFSIDTEFMVSFFLEDNGNGVSVSTHQNLTINNPKVLSLAKPTRYNETNVKVPTNGFLSNDVLIGGVTGERLRSFENAEASYSVFLNTTDSELNISSALTTESGNSFDSFYVYDSKSGRYLFIPNPIVDNYVLNKGELNESNLESRKLIISSPRSITAATEVLQVFGATSEEDRSANKFHKIYNFYMDGVLDFPAEYYLNTSFYSYRHDLEFGNYYTERKGAPIENYQIPDVGISYTSTGNEIDLSVQGTNHIVGRADVRFKNTQSVWYVTFDSKKNSNIIVPELPESISHPIKIAYENGGMEVNSVELISYESIFSYEDYVKKVVKNNTDILDVTDWYQLIFSSKGNFNGPNKEFVFQ